jgi:phospholipid/cholesterol/gamma-HCH transport system substrate-binding protein
VNRAMRVRLIAFLLLAAAGIVFVSANYLGVFNTIFGKQVSMYVDLPRSGGLYVGSEVDVRGVRVGKVSGMDLTPQGVRVTIRVDKDARIPTSAPLNVADLTAVGEQYLNFSPTDPNGASVEYARAGHVFAGTEKSLGESTDQLLLDINRFVTSVPQDSLKTTISELGRMFTGRADDLGRMIDSGQLFIDEAAKNQQATIDLINHSKTVLATQVAHASDIQNFAAGLAQFTGALKDSDGNLRSILAHGHGAITEADGLVNDLSAVMPSFLANLIPVNKVVTDRLVALEETLIVFPNNVYAGFTGTPGDGFGHLNMQFDYSIPACSGNGYLPKPWPDTQNLSDLPLFPARCLNPKADPNYRGPGAMLQRGVQMVPPVR